jgi:ketosteroid isomerase-like protein
MKLKTICVLGLVCLGVACAPQTAQESSEIAAAAGRWQELLNAKDIEGLVAMYSDDCRLLPPNGKMAQGGDAVRESFSGMIEAGLTGELKTIEAMAAGDIGYRVGTYALNAPDGSTVDRGKYIETWRKDAGEWKLVNDIWNSDMPVPEPNVLVTHKVKDGDHWVAAWSGEESRHGFFAKNGAPKVDVFRSADDPNYTALAIQVTDMAAFQAMLESDEVAAAKRTDGVIDRGMQVFAKVD